MKTDKELLLRMQKRNWPDRSSNRVTTSLQDKTGATAEQIRRAIEIVGFDRDKVEQYLKNGGKLATRTYGPLH